MRRWNKIRAGLKASDPESILNATIALGKVESGELPDDVAQLVVGLFDHRDPEIRAEAVRALGIHWRLASAAGAIADFLNRGYDPPDVPDDCYAIGALAAIGTAHEDARCFVSKTLAGVVLNERFDVYDRRHAYVELQLVEGKIDLEEFYRRMRDRPEPLQTFETDQLWLSEILQRECPPAIGDGQQSPKP